MKKRLNPQERKAVKIYLADGCRNMYEAYIGAGYAPGNRANASSFFRRPHIQREVEAGMAKVFAKLDYDAKKYMRTLLEGINLDPTALLDEEGNITIDTIEEMPIHFRKFIQKLRKTKVGFTIDFTDKASLLNLMARALNLTDEKAAVSNFNGPTKVIIHERRTDEDDKETNTAVNRCAEMGVLDKTVTGSEHDQEAGD